MHIASYMPELSVCIIYANFSFIFISAYTIILIMVFIVYLYAELSTFTANILTF